MASGPMEDVSSGHIQPIANEDELETYWDRGMTSRRSPLVIEAGEKTGIAVKAIKVWVSNKKKRVKRALEKQEGIEPKRREKIPLRKKRGYDLFMSDRLNQDDLKAFGKERKGEKLKIAQKAWRELPDSEKEKWHEKAGSQPTPTEGKATRKLASVQKKCAELWAMDVGVTLFIPDGCGSFDICSPPETKTFWKKHEKDDLLTKYGDELLAHMYKAAVTTKNADRLRREIKHLFNSKYEEATGKIGSCSYTAMDAGRLIAHGLPEGLELKRPSEYNMSEKRAVLQNADDITFQVLGVQNEEEQAPHDDCLDVPVNRQDDPIPVPESDEEVTTHELEIETVPNTDAGMSDTNHSGSVLAGPIQIDEEDEVTRMLAAESIRKAELLARQQEAKMMNAANRKKKSEKKKLSAKKRYLEGLVGRRVEHLWELSNSSKDFFKGTVVRTTEGEYKIKFDDNKEEPLTPAKTKRLFKKKVLRFI